jgi:hypothetical protein
LVLHGYEGGAGCGNCSLEGKTIAVRDNRMTDLCVAYLNGWYRYGFETLSWCVAGASQTTSTGSWCLMEDMREEVLFNTTVMFNSTSPVAKLSRPSQKLKATDVVRSSSIELTFGIEIPSYTVNATNFINHSVPFSKPDLRNLSLN